MLYRALSVCKYTHSDKARVNPSDVCESFHYHLVKAALFQCKWYLKGIFCDSCQSKSFECLCWVGNIQNHKVGTFGQKWRRHSGRDSAHFPSFSQLFQGFKRGRSSLLAPGIQLQSHVMKWKLEHTQIFGPTRSRARAHPQSAWAGQREWAWREPAGKRKVVLVSAAEAGAVA